MATRSTRMYLALAGLGLGGAGFAAQALRPPQAEAQSLFESAPLLSERVIALAQPLAGSRWNLLVLEQLQPGVSCWQRLADGSVLSMADGVRNESYCGRYGSSSAYSLRVGGADLASTWRLKLEARQDRLELTATSPQTSNPIVVASAPLPQSGGGALTPLALEPGWALERRSYNGRALNHLYLSNAEPLPALIARANGPLLAAPPLLPPPAATASRSRRERERLLPLSMPPATASEPQPGEVIALQVVPFSE